MNTGSTLAFWVLKPIGELLGVLVLFVSLMFLVFLYFQIQKALVTYKNWKLAREVMIRRKNYRRGLERKCKGPL